MSHLGKRKGQRGGWKKEKREENRKEEQEWREGRMGIREEGVRGKEEGRREEWGKEEGERNGGRRRSRMKCKTLHEM